MKRHAFTLIELLVVIAILGLLAAVLFPVFAKVREKGRQTACLSNLRQLGMAVYAYAQENDRLLPPYNSKGIETGDGRVIPEHGAQLVSCLTPYTHDRDIWFCPTDIYARTFTAARVKPPDWVWADGRVNHLYTSYGNTLDWYSPGFLLGKQTIDWPGSSSEQSSAVQGPVLLTDDLWFFRAGSTEIPPPYSHNGRFNFVMFDGHVKSLSWDAVYTGSVEPAR